MRPPDDPAQFEHVLVSCISRIESDGDSGLEAICDEYPVYAEELRERIRDLVDAGLLSLGEADDVFPERLGEFRLIERLGSGGMGVVFLAEQESMGRRVALKVVRHEQLFDARVRARFAREVATVARLAHPGIVPVYAVGEDQGLPYFAMEYVRGASLERVVARLRDKRPDELTGADLLAAIEAVSGLEAEAGAAARPPFDGSWVDACLWIAREVAQALEHAHQRGVLHRDIKPSNVMLTLGGRVQLVDFGLARSVGSDSMTRTGAQLGSWHYMPPEHVAGEAGDHGPHTDVYSLGVSLFELLALRLPFLGATVRELCENIMAARHPRLTKLVPGISRDLEAVVSVAMALEPERRYVSAADFANDMTRVIEGRPVEARATGAWVQLARWTKRHKGAAAAVGISAAVAVVGPLLFGWQQVRANELVMAQMVRADTEAGIAREQRTIADLEREEAVAQSRLAEQNLTVALEAVDTMLIQVGKERLADIPRVQEIRRELLETAHEFFGRLDDQAGGSPSIQRSRASAGLSLALLERRLGREAESEATLWDQVEIVEGLVASEAREPADYGMLALALRRLAVCRLDEKDAEGALELTDRGLDALRDSGVDEDEPLSVRIQIYNTRAQAFFDLGRVEAAIAASERAIELGRRQCDEASESGFVCTDLVVALSKLGVVLLRSDPARSAAVLEEAWERQLARIDADPLNAEARRTLCKTGTNTILALSRVGRHEDALVIANQAVEVAEELVRDYPAVLQHASQLGMLRLNLASQLGEFGRNEASLAASEQALPVLRRLVDEEPESVMRLHTLAAGLTTQSSALKELGRFEESGVALDEALVAHRQAVAIHPSPEYRYHLGIALANRASLVISTGDYELAAPILEETLPLLRKSLGNLYFIAVQWMRASAAI
ncbi:MAG: serine/threonine protein kinase, partial [Planctomycetota bacterium]